MTWYAGGGGGGVNEGYPAAGIGGSGVGGTGGGHTGVPNATPGVTNSGGGGGGGGIGLIGAAGGSGIVVLSYNIPEPSTMSLLGLLGGALFLRRKLRK